MMPENNGFGSSRGVIASHSLFALRYVCAQYTKDIDAERFAKGARITSIVPEASFQSSYLWDALAAPELSEEHSYRLPTALNLQQTLEYPIRLRYTAVTTAVRALAVACNSFGRVIGIEAHDSSFPLLYNRIESSFLKSAITWLYCPFSPSEAISEIVLPGSSKPDNTRMFCSSIEVGSHKHDQLLRTTNVCSSKLR